LVHLAGKGKLLLTRRHALLGRQITGCAGRFIQIGCTPYYILVVLVNFTSSFAHVLVWFDRRPRMGEVKSLRTRTILARHKHLPSLSFLGFYLQAVLPSNNKLVLLCTAVRCGAPFAALFSETFSDRMPREHEGLELNPKTTLVWFAGSGLRDGPIGRRSR